MLKSPHPMIADPPSKTRHRPSWRKVFDVLDAHVWILFLLLLLLALGTGCVAGSRIANDQHRNFVPAGGRQIRPVQVGLFGLITLTVGAVDTGLQSADVESSYVGGESIFSQTGLAGLAGSTTSTRHGTNTVKTVGYDLKELQTDVSTNADQTISAGGSAVGNIIKNALKP